MHTIHIPVPVPIPVFALNIKVLAILSLCTHPPMHIHHTLYIILAKYIRNGSNYKSDNRCDSNTATLLRADATPTEISCMPAVPEMQSI